MKLKVLKTFYCGDGAFTKGQTVDVKDELAQRLLADGRGLVEAVKAKKKEEK